MNVFIETAQDSEIRTRYDENTFQQKESFKVGSQYPYAYGFIVGSNKKHKDCIDCYILTNDKLVEGNLIACEPVFMIEVYEGVEEDHKVVMKTLEYEIGDEEQVVNTIKSFITKIFSENPEIIIRFGKRIGKAETINFIRSRMRE